MKSYLIRWRMGLEPNMSWEFYMREVSKLRREDQSHAAALFNAVSPRGCAVVLAACENVDRFLDERVLHGALKAG
jgi:hypothetical protein